MNKSIKRVFSTLIAVAMVACTPLFDTSVQGESFDTSTDKSDVTMTSDSTEGGISKDDIPEYLTLDA